MFHAYGGYEGYDTGNTRFRDLRNGGVELYHGSLSGPWVAIEQSNRVLPPPNLPTNSLLPTWPYHGKIQRHPTVLQKVPNPQTRPCTSLLHLQPLRTQNGPSLPLARHLPRTVQLQTVPSIPHIHLLTLYTLLPRFHELGLGHGFERWSGA